MKLIEHPKQLCDNGVLFVLHLVAGMFSFVMF
jgi:hypothetical protein